MKVVPDTNILVSSLSRRSKSNWVIQAFLKKDFDLVVTHEMLLEYEEILKIKYAIAAVDNFLRSIKDSENVEIWSKFIFNGNFFKTPTTTNL
ncbi:MAG: PIN domain-containing protein [Saprospiraceae bacterium]|nr:PIN domain-containing protein [Saprospiraceae bacterium]